MEGCKLPVGLATWILKDPGSGSGRRLNSSSIYGEMLNALKGDVLIFLFKKCGNLHCVICYFFILIVLFF